MKLLCAMLVSLFLAACGSTGLKPLVLDGHELHESLVLLQVVDMPLHVPHAVLSSNPQFSTDAQFVQAVAGGGSQGQLGSSGIRAALYAVYRGQSQIGIYGLEAASMADADRLESRLREIWAMNASLDRARVHRGGKVLVVAWNAPETPSCWEAVSAVLAERLRAF